MRLELDGPFDLDLTLGCGQVFRWEQRDGYWEGVVGDRAIRVRQKESELLFEGADEEFIRHYFQLDLDLDRITSGFDRDEKIHAAIERCRGLRLVCQPAWECTASYLCATYSSIPLIRRRIRMLSCALGREISSPFGTFYSFPAPAELSSSDPLTLKECRTGYRAGYLRATAEIWGNDGRMEERISGLPTREARKVLMELPGVGRKAADCILLFAFQRFESFPVDVWIGRIMRRHYPEALGEKGEKGDAYERIAGFAREYFGPHAGYAQEYLYASRATCLPPSPRDMPPAPG